MLPVRQHERCFVQQIQTAAPTRERAGCGWGLRCVAGSFDGAMMSTSEAGLTETFGALPDLAGRRGVPSACKLKKSVPWFARLGKDPCAGMTATLPGVRTAARAASRWKRAGRLSDVSKT